MNELADYSIFVNAAYIISGLIFGGFMIISLFKFQKNQQKLKNLKENEKAKS